MPRDVDLRAFMEITAANELDALAHDPELAAKYGPPMRRLFTRARGLLSAAAWEACDRRTTDGHIT